MSIRKLNEYLDRSKFDELSASILGPISELSNTSTLSKITESNNLPLWIGSAWPGGSSNISNQVIDLTGYLTDYELQVGQTALMSFTNATTIPLRVATVEGLYEINILRTDGANPSTNSTYCCLMPNNTAYSSSFTCQRSYQYGAVNSTGAELTMDRFYICEDKIIQGRITVSTIKTDKTCIGEAYCRRSDAAFNCYNGGRWNDTTTSWSSLGSISTGTAFSGKVIIKRIL